MLVVIGSGWLGPMPALAGGRLAATGGVQQLEGAAGGGLVPWALIGGLGTDDEVGGSAFCAGAGLRDFGFGACGVTIGLRNRLEWSIARQRFDLRDVVPGQSIVQTVVGAKLRLYGDAVVDQDRGWPQLALGVQWKRNHDFELVPALLGAKRRSGVDWYLSASKLAIAGPAGRTWLVSATLRRTCANQLGLLGFGGPRGSGAWVGEGSVAVFVSDTLIVGAEYRAKPDLLASVHEDAARDAFVAWVPVKAFSVTLAAVDLGSIAGQRAQHGWYASLQSSW